ncbi:hypothetical protein RPMA_00170 [Tardiphaga alba]|uniref:LysR substrate-binding domain-containing protein n=1 Tax=Tardiphaga alba TaxID=340268 RepID=A0ABX8A2T4_9BRAD|nr:LysR substrate-binding domain-containing protein [Tardiphaga alba]QUS37461.1 hypothetical protein RPMA_00170 [Tardiphaga alba]
MEDSKDLNGREALAESGALMSADLAAIGRRLIGLAHQALSQNPHYSRYSSDTDDAPVRIGISSMLLSFLVDHPAETTLANVSVTSDICSKIVKAFDDDDVDVAMVMDVKDHRAILGDDLVAEFDIEFGWVRSTAFSVEMDAPIPLATWPPDQHIILKALSDAGRSYKVMFTGPDYASKLTAVRSGRCLAVVPRHAIASPLVEARDDQLPTIAPKKILLAVRGDSSSTRVRDVVSALSSFPLAGPSV